MWYALGGLALLGAFGGYRWWSARKSGQDSRPIWRPGDDGK